MERDSRPESLALRIQRRTDDGPLPVVWLLEVCGMQCGLIPAWWSKAEPPRSTINARIEDAAAKLMWRTTVKHTRCLVPSLGWYD